MSTCVVREVAWRAPACGLKAAYRPTGRTPICEKHLCRYGQSGARGPRCFEVPLRLVYSVRDSGGLLPDDNESFFCQDHDRYACRATIQDGSRCPEERRSGTEYCRTHTESVCQARTRGGACHSVATDGSDFCSQHRCANGVGGRGPEGHCRNQRVGSTAFCDDHICIWRDSEGVRCDKQSPHSKACCVKHTCSRCEYGSEDTTSHCIYHLCAWGRRGKSREWPPCDEAVDREGYCGRHGIERCGTVDPTRMRRNKPEVVLDRGPYGIERSGTVDPTRMRRRMLQKTVEYVPAYEEDDTTQYYSDPDYRPTVTIPRVPKATRSGSTRMMKRLEYTEDTDRGREEWSLRPWRPRTPY